MCWPTAKNWPLFTILSSVMQWSIRDLTPWKNGLESTGYSALPLPHAVDTWYKQLGGHTHSVTAWRWAAQYLHWLSGGKGKNISNISVNCNTGLNLCKLSCCHYKLMTCQTCVLSVRGVLCVSRVLHSCCVKCVTWTSLCSLKWTTSSRSWKTPTAISRFAFLHSYHISETHQWLDGVTVRALDLWSSSRGFKFPVGPLSS